MDEELDGDFFMRAARGTASEWIMRELMKVPGVESCGIVDGQLFAWPDMAFSKQEVQAGVTPLIKRAEARFNIYRA